MCPVDLHIHTTGSDGSLTLQEILPLAQQCGLSAIAITDHESVSGLKEGYLSNAWNIEVIPGMEIGIRDEPHASLIDIDILGYFIDPHHPILLRTLERITASKNQWALEQIGLIERIFQIRLSPEEVATFAADSPCIRRPHIWSALQRNFPGLMKTEEYFQRTDWQGDLFVPKDFELTLEQCIELIHQVGGVAVLAHPFNYRHVPYEHVEAVVWRCVRAGLDGLETWYPYKKRAQWNPRQLVEQAQRLARKYDLVCTGGSDFHGPGISSTPLGAATADEQVLSELKKRCR